MRGAVSPLAIQIPKLSPHPPPPPPPSHGLSAISLAEQLAQHALLQLGRRALRLAARLQEFEEKLLEIVLLLARREGSSASDCAKTPARRRRSCRRAGECRRTS